MARTQTPDDDRIEVEVAPEDGDEALRKRLLSRVAVAGVAIVGLLGGLAVFDSLNKPQVTAVPKMAVVQEEAVKEEKTVEEKPEEKVAENTGEAAAETKAASIPAEPEKTEAPVVTNPQAEKPLKLPKAVTPPATAHMAAIKPSEKIASPAKPDAKAEIARVIPEDTRPGKAAPATTGQAAVVHAPPSRPLIQAAEAAKRFLVQVGVFSNHANAEELAVRLQEAGIPAHVESRVQVGPFATRAEVDAARAKLKSLGIDDGMLVRR